MTTPNVPNHKRRKLRLSLESLETRELMTGGAGNNFAIMTGDVTTAGGSTALTFTVDPSHFTLPHGKMTLGIDVVAQTGATLKPMITGIQSSSGQLLPFTHAVYDPKVQRSNSAEGNETSAVLVPISLPRNGTSTSETFKVDVSGLDETSGQFLVGFYLPGDVQGTGDVTQADLQQTRSLLRANANDTQYNFYADANRDGVISPTDVSITRKNLGVETTISPSVTSNLNPASVSQSGTRVTNIKTVNFTGTATPGATITYTEINGLTPAVSTTANSSGNYSINIPLAVGSNTFKVTSHDAFNQTITGQIQPVTYDPSAVPMVNSSTS